MVEVKKKHHQKRIQAKHHRKKRHGPAAKTLLMWGAKDKDNPEALRGTSFGARKPKTSLPCVTLVKLDLQPLYCLFKKVGRNNPFISTTKIIDKPNNKCFPLPIVKLQKIIHQPS